MNRAVSRTCLRVLALLCLSNPVWAGESIMVAGIPLDFILFALTLLGVALFHNYTLYVGLLSPSYRLDIVDK